MPSPRLAAFLILPFILASCAGPHDRSNVAPQNSAPVVAPDAPAPRDEFLDRLAGDWNMNRSVHGKTYHCDAEARWVLGDRWVCLHLKPAAEPPQPGRLPYEALVYLGFDAHAQEYLAYWHDTFGAAFGPPGRGKRVNDRLELCWDDGGDSRIWNTFTYDRAADTWTSLIQNQTKGQVRTFFAQETYQRR